MRNVKIFCLIMLACGTSYAGEVVLVIHANRKPVGPGVSVQLRRGGDLFGGTTNKHGIYRIEAERNQKVKYVIVYKGEEFPLETTFARPSGAYDVVLYTKGGKPAVAVRKRKKPLPDEGAEKRER